MRTFKQIERELHEAEAVVSYGGYAQYDNNGNLQMTASEVRATYARRAENLRQELADLHRVFAEADESRVAYMQRMDGLRQGLIGKRNAFMENLDE